MSKEVRTTVGYMSTNPEDVPEDKILIGFFLPRSMIREFHLGDPITLVVPEGGK